MREIFLLKSEQGSPLHGLVLRGEVDDEHQDYKDTHCHVDHSEVVYPEELHAL